ncbi:inactive protein RESTRICTED TEV MOVEMENT 2-like [Hibiscus syriacus]|uniref:inactive protein RESTRICTED TEV MOVEMENT 2-like n=1 Tax=Hibiscus syriacus TaxID=106335 RepID=UPI0019221245|nr:inactive protein RESTRICTED TEV MOVEMENT 2-like [Hibiscus syriacus]
MSRSYIDFQPDCQYKEGEAQDIIEFQLKDFRKDQLKVHFGNNGVLTISGERPLEGSKWIRFCKEFATPKDCKPTEIRARFSTSLYITIPKEITPLQVATTVVQGKGKLEQERSIRQSGDVAGESVTGISKMARHEWSISRLKIDGKTAMKIGASLIVAAMPFIVLFHVFKFKIP